MGWGGDLNTKKVNDEKELWFLLFLLKQVVEFTEQSTDVPLFGGQEICSTAKPFPMLLQWSIRSLALGAGGWLLGLIAGLAGNLNKMVFWQLSSETSHSAWWRSG